jgi:hypothetical protein
MNCFDASKDFCAFWRRTIPLSDRARLVEHLAACAQCDRSFRAFALTAPVMHSERLPEATSSSVRPPLSLVRPRRFAAGRAGPFARPTNEHPWRVAAAAAALLVIGGFTAWSFTEMPAENFAEGVVADSPEVESAGYSLDSSTATGSDASVQEPALFDAIAPEPSATGDNGLAG